eukprot:GILK01011442.1.p1 GENE.GILK01011442.1~~GILK01011442.1.p1  ORF type:complete len:1190 (-),score=363.56 GILK01011442.1:40-3564(-)
MEIATLRQQLIDSERLRSELQQELYQQTQPFLSRHAGHGSTPSLEVAKTELASMRAALCQKDIELNDLRNQMRYVIVMKDTHSRALENEVEDLNRQVVHLHTLHNASSRKVKDLSSTIAKRENELKVELHRLNESRQTESQLRSESNQQIEELKTVCATYHRELDSMQRYIMQVQESNREQELTQELNLAKTKMQSMEVELQELQRSVGAFGSHQGSRLNDEPATQFDDLLRSTKQQYEREISRLKEELIRETTKVMRLEVLLQQREESRVGSSHVDIQCELIPSGHFAIVNQLRDELSSVSQKNAELKANQSRIDLSRTGMEALTWQSKYEQTLESLRVHEERNRDLESQLKTVDAKAFSKDFMEELLEECTLLKQQLVSIDEAHIIEKHELTQQLRQEYSKVVEPTSQIKAEVMYESEDHGLRATVERLTMDMHQVELELAQAQTDLARSIQCEHELREQMDRVKHELSRVQDDAASQLREKEESIQQADQVHNDSLAKAASRFTESIKEKEKIIQNLEQKVKELEHKLNRVTAELSQTQLNHIPPIVHEVPVSPASCVTVETIQLLQEEVRELKAAKQRDMDDMMFFLREEKKKDLTRQRNEFETKIEQLELQLASNGSQPLQTVQTVQTVGDRIATTVASCQTEIVSETASCQTQLVSASISTQTEHGHKLESVAVQCESILQVESPIAVEMQQKCEGLQLTVDSISEQCRHKTLELEAAQARFITQFKQIQTMKTEIQRLEEENSKVIQERINQGEEASRKLEQSIQKLVQDHELRLQNMKLAHEAQLTELTAESSRQSSSKKEDARRFKRDLAELEKKWSSKLQSSEQHADDLRSESTSLKKRLSVLTRELKTTKDELDQQRIKSQSIQLSFSHLGTEVVTVLQTVCNDLNRQYRFMQQSNLSSVHSSIDDIVTVSTDDEEVNSLVNQLHNETEEEPEADLSRSFSVDNLPFLNMPGASADGDSRLDRFDGSVIQTKVTELKRKVIRLIESLRTHVTEAMKKDLNQDVHMQKHIAISDSVKDRLRSVNDDLYHILLQTNSTIEIKSDDRNPEKTYTQFMSQIKRMIRFAYESTKLNNNRLRNSNSSIVSTISNTSVAVSETNSVPRQANSRCITPESTPRANRFANYSPVSDRSSLQRLMSIAQRFEQREKMLRSQVVESPLNHRYKS